MSHEKKVRLRGKKLQPAQPSPIRLSFGTQVFSLVTAGNRLFTLSLQGTLRFFLHHYGVRLPEIEFRLDPALSPFVYQLDILQFSGGQGELRPGRVLALGEEPSLGPLIGEVGTDPIYGLPGKWILPAHAEAALELGCHLVDPETVLSTHLMERLPLYLADFVRVEEVLARLDLLEPGQPRLIQKVRSHLGGGRLLRVIRELLRERVSVADLVPILEGCLAARDRNDLDQLLERARARMGATLVESHLDCEGALPALVLAEGVAARWQTEFARETSVEGWFCQLFLDQLQWELGACMEQGLKPVLVVDGKIRRDLALLCQRVVPDLAVLSWGEIPSQVEVVEMGTIGSRLHPAVSRWSVGHHRVTADRPVATLAPEM